MKQMRKFRYTPSTGEDAKTINLPMRDRIEAADQRLSSLP